LALHSGQTWIKSDLPQRTQCFAADEFLCPQLGQHITYHLLPLVMLSIATTIVNKITLTIEPTIAPKYMSRLVPKIVFAIAPQIVPRIAPAIVTSIAPLIETKNIPKIAIAFAEDGDLLRP